MRLEEACRRFNELAGIRFGDLFSPADMNMIIIKNRTAAGIVSWDAPFKH